MTIETVWITKRKFKYNGKLLNRGDVWEPIGGRNDAGIKRHLVELVEREAPEKTSTSRRRKRKASNG